MGMSLLEAEQAALTVSSAPRPEDVFEDR
jgi:hypothetical protein